MALTMESDKQLSHGYLTGYSDEEIDAGIFKQLFTLR